jgi:signal transduction histidine kinase
VRRRLTIAMVLMVFGTLVLSGLVSLDLAANSATDQTRHELMHEAQGLAASVTTEALTVNRNDPAKALRNLLAGLKSPLRLEGSAVLVVSPQGSFIDPVTPRRSLVLPGGLSAADLQPQSLLALQPVSGSKNGVVFAAYPYQATVQILGAARNVVQVVVLTRRPPSALGSAGPWFALSSLVILVVAWALSRRLGRRFVKPIRAAEEATSRIAAGDLDVRVPAPPGTDPELAALAGSVNSMATRLAEAKDAERHFLQSVSHDLRTPLTSIRGFAEAIEDGATADVVAAAAVIASEARRLERLVSDLVGLASLEAKRFNLEPRPLDLKAAVNSVTAGFAPAAAELNLTLAVDPSAPAAVWVHADPDRLAQVVANLIENALRYAAKVVRVGVGLAPEGAVITVEDDGSGISPEDMPRIFERLFVARPRPDRPIGSGLGLTIVAELTHAMGGSVRAESPVHDAGGTRMVVTLPAVPSSVPEHPVTEPTRSATRS